MEGAQKVDEEEEKTLLALLRFLVTCTRVLRRGEGVSGIENRRKVRN